MREDWRIASCIQLSLFWPELSDTPFGELLVVPGVTKESTQTWSSMAPP